MNPSVLSLFALLYILSMFLIGATNFNPQCMDELINVIDNATWQNETLSQVTFELDKLQGRLMPHFKEGKIMEGGSGDADMLTERKLYYAISKSKCIRTICEIGFNAGHSALLWLMANPSAKVVMFDIWEHFYNDLALQHILEQKQFMPDRLVIVKGNSQHTVRKYHTDNPSFRCDLISIDGSHKFHDAVHDIENMMKMANRTWNVLLLDDTNCNHHFCVDRALNVHLIRRNVRRVDGYTIDQRGLSILQYTRATN